MIPRIFTAAQVLLAAVVVYAAVSLFYTLALSRLGPVETASPAPAPGEPAGEDARGRPADYQRIVERNLFHSRRGGAEEAARPAPEVDLDKLKPTELKLRLWGTGVGGDGRAYAVIEDAKTREQALYRPGDTVQNASVKRIFRGRVVLTVAGRDEVLAQEEPGATARAAAPGTAAARTEATAPVRPPEPAETVERVSVSPAQAEEALANLGDLLNQATFRPHLEDGKPAGISITAIKPNAIFRKLRLRNGDIITGVNGRSIATVDDALNVFNSLSLDGPVQVQIKRRGQEQTLEYRID